MMFFWIILIIAAIMLFSFFSGQDASETGRAAFVTETPLDVLKERYARGELTQAEFVRMKMEIQ
ncbi:MAG: SHOCT domain-containing protein [Desulfohalobiaceae bacterium]|nr:SHOCT domain-containing protein [Desulfohalobiaceae bacterium]